MKVKEAMNRPFIIDKDIGLSEAAKIMSDKNIGSLIVVFNGNIKGIITDTDLVKNFDSKSKVSEIMSKKVITIGSNEGLDEAAIRMKKNKIKRLPVLEEDKLVGIITATDLIANSEELDEDFLIG